MTSRLPNFYTRSYAEAERKIRIMHSIFSASAHYLAMTVALVGPVSSRGAADVPLTPEDRRRINEAVVGVGIFADLRDWQRVQGYVADPVTTADTSLFGRSSTTTPEARRLLLSESGRSDPTILADAAKRVSRSTTLKGRML